MRNIWKDWATLAELCISINKDKNKSHIQYRSFMHLSICCTVVGAAVIWASYQIHKIAGCACAGNAGNVFPRRRFKRKPLVSDPGMHHGTCVTHVPWCMSGSLTCGDGENVPGIPGACAPAILRIWQEAHGEWRPTHAAFCIMWAHISQSCLSSSQSNGKIEPFSVSFVKSWVYAG